MRMFDWTEKSSAVLSQCGVMSPDATKLLPILMGFDPNSAISTSGIGTLFLFSTTGGKVPG